MSGVFQRFHTPTGWQFVDNGVAIETQIYAFVRNEKNIPKRSWFSHGLPLFKLAQTLNARICDIKSVYPTTEAEVENEKLLIQYAIQANEQIIKMLQMTLLEIPGIDANKLDKIGDLFVNETKLLRALKTSVKVCAQKQA